MIHQKKNRGQGISKIVKSRQSYNNDHLPCHLRILLHSACVDVRRGVWICLPSKDAQILTHSGEFEPSKNGETGKFL